MRNRFFWLLATIMMCGAMTTGLTSCSNIDNNDGNNNVQKRVALLLPDASRIDRWAIDLANLEDAMATYRIKTTSYVAPETEEGAMQQVEQLKTAINNGVKYIVLTTIDYQKINESGLLQQHPDDAAAAAGLFDAVEGGVGVGVFPVREGDAHAVTYSRCSGAESMAINPASLSGKSCA